MDDTWGNSAIPRGLNGITPASNPSFLYRKRFLSYARFSHVFQFFLLPLAVGINKNGGFGKDYEVLVFP
ncbi:hypothetical protein POVWA2_033100 [Plasmodium ovale wallikeri]|uniref:Uncharacterized protein n=1 Tax=Plasmodium ovale wallikeri TaxID=864142 RepID=A0A1A8YZF6_PLAOA|nr:hypothetical protein POVWA1_033480 [Plasmodium ovale wallikeri]SBT37093.1 hypothetical protein POVWA2_033100 [Plasmodium ovale wallikeri]